jgi:hypothetical protein
MFLKKKCRINERRLVPCGAAHYLDSQLDLTRGEHLVGGVEEVEDLRQPTRRIRGSPLQDQILAPTAPRKFSEKLRLTSTVYAGIRSGDS